LLTAKIFFIVEVMAILKLAALSQVTIFWMLNPYPGRFGCIIFFLLEYLIPEWDLGQEKIGVDFNEDY